jgi:hypothetical protein
MKHLTILMIFLSVHFTAVTQPQSEGAYFVIVGTFRMLDNAVRYAQEASRNGLMAQYAICPTTGLYYVYVLETNDHLRAHNLSIKLTEETNFKKAWVFNGKLGLENNTMTPADIRAQRIQETESKLNNLPTIESKTEVFAETKPFYFRLVSRYDNKEIVGDLFLKETGELWSYQSVKSNKVVFLKEPHGRQKSYSVVALIPGYRQSGIVFFYANPPIEAGPNNEEIITLTLDKTKSPDFIEFNNVQFYGPTSSLRTVSRNELTELSYMLKEKSKCKIIIHGHCSKQDQEIFERNNYENQQGAVSPKSLALARAEAAKAVLVELGIEPSRIFTKGDELLHLAGDYSSDWKTGSIEIEFLRDNLTSTL